MSQQEPRITQGLLTMGLCESSQIQNWKKNSFRVEGRLGGTYLQDEIPSSLLNYVRTLKNNYLLPSLYSFQPWNVKNSFNPHYFFFFFFCDGKDEITFLVCGFVQGQWVAKQVLFYFIFNFPCHFHGLLNCAAACSGDSKLHRDLSS